MAGDPDSSRRRARARRLRGGARPLRVDVVSGLDGRAHPPVAGLARWLERAAPPRAWGEVTIYLTTDARIRSLNRRYRGKDHVTDVLSFPAWGRRLREPSTREPGTRTRHQAPRTPPFLGDVVIAIGRARRQADDVGHSLATELRILSLHGLLHLVGFDHEKDDGLMARVERTLRRRAGLREGLIERAGGGR